MDKRLKKENLGEVNNFNIVNEFNIKLFYVRSFAMYAVSANSRLFK